MVIPPLGLVSHFCKPQIGCGVDRPHQILAGINRTIFLNQWGLPDIRISPDHLLEFFKLDFLCLNRDSLGRNHFTAWIYEKKDTFLIFRRNKLILHFKWSAFKQKFKKSEIMIESYPCYSDDVIHFYLKCIQQNCVKILHLFLLSSIHKFNIQNIKKVSMSFRNIFSTVRRKKEKGNLQSRESVFVDEKRKHPRIRVEFPLSFSPVDYEEIHAGIVANASEGGLLVYLHKAMGIGTELKTEIIYLKDFELDTIKGIAKVVWSDLVAKGSVSNYRCGLQYHSFQKGDFHKLKILLKEGGETFNR